MPNFFIRLRSVFGCTPRITAAPFAPSTTPPVDFSTLRMCAFWTSSRLPGCADWLTGSLLADERALGENRGALQDVLEFPDVAGPGVVLELRQASRADALQRFSESTGHPAEEEANEERNVGRALAQRGNFNWKHIQPVEEIGA